MYSLVFETVRSHAGEYVAELSPDLVLVDVKRIRDKWPKLPTGLDAAFAYGSRFAYFFKVRNLYFERRLYKRAGVSVTQAEVA